MKVELHFIGLAGRDVKAEADVYAWVWEVAGHNRHQGACGCAQADIAGEDVRVHAALVVELSEAGDAWEGGLDLAVADGGKDVAQVVGELEVFVAGL